MTFTAGQLLQRLDELARGVPVRRYLVAFSGGLDSSVLLHALATSRPRHGIAVAAVHVNHRMQPAADDWEGHCRAVAASLDVSLAVCRISVAGAGRGMEAAAREARYAAIAAEVRPEDMVLSAHHEEDQGETLLLNLLRASGPDGLAGIGAVQRFAGARLARPLLDVARADILAYATEQGLDWVEDASNEDAAFDRNFLRRRIMPRLRDRWPAAASALSRSAELAAESRELLTELAELDLAALGTPGSEGAAIDAAGLGQLSAARQRNALRRAIARRGLPPAPAKRLHEAVATLIPARRDARPLVAWPGAELRAYRGRLYLMRALPERLPEAPLRLAADGEPLDLGPGLGALRLVRAERGGLHPDRVGRGLEVRFRGGGERLRPQGRRETHALKKLLQEAGIVPWMRERLPLLYAEDCLVGVADLWVAASAWRAPGLAVHWSDRPALT